MKGFHQYRRYNGHAWTRCERASLCMGKTVCEDWANLLLNEKVQITIEGQAEQEFVDRILAENNFSVNGNKMQELKFALGTGAYVPRVVGQELSAEGFPVSGSAAGIAIDYITMEYMYPLAWANGAITECAFTSVLTENGHKHLYMQIHRRDENGLYVVENRVYRYDNDVLADESIADVRALERIPPVVHTGSEKRQFVVDQPNIANNYDPTLPVGIPVYANAIDALRGVDQAFDCYINEFENGALMLMVKMPATRYDDGQPTLDDRDRRFYILPEDTQQGNVVEPISPALRTQALSIGVQDQLNLLSSKCGFGEAHYRFDGGGVATATQVISENSTMFRTLRKHEMILEQVLKELCRTIIRLGNAAMNAGLDENVEISIKFDDSIIVDTETDRAQDRQDVSMGAMNLWEYRAKWYGEDEATAKKMLPTIEDLTDEEETEAE